MPAKPPQRKPSGPRATWAALTPLQRISVLALAAQLVFWGTTGRVEPAFIYGFGGLVGIEEGRKAVGGKEE